MSEPVAPHPPRPPHVWGAAVLTMILALYAEAMAVPLCISGAFVGPHILIPGVVHAILGPVLLVSCLGLWNRRRWARYLLLILSGVMALGLPVAIARDAISGALGREGKEGALVFLVFALVFGLIAWNLSRPAVRRWLNGHTSKYGSTGFLPVVDASGPKNSR